MQGNICYKFVNFSTQYTRVLIPDRAARTGFSALPKAFLSEEGGAAQAVTEGAAREQIRLRVHLIRILSIDKTSSVLPRSGNPAPSQGSLALSVAPRHLSQRERRVESCETKAFLSEEGGTAQAVTEGAARGQIRLKVNLMRILPIDKLPQSCRKAASQLPQRGSQPSLSLRDISPRGRDKTSSREKQTVSASLIPKPARFIY